MIEFILYNKSSSEISEIIAELKSRGLKINIDFDFEFHTGSYDWEYNSYIPRWTKFTFYNEKEGTWFVLKWT